MTNSTAQMDLYTPSSEAQLPSTRTVQAFDRKDTVEWMETSGLWGVSYPISGDTLSQLKAIQRLGEEAFEEILENFWTERELAESK